MILGLGLLCIVVLIVIALLVAALPRRTSDSPPDSPFLIARDAHKVAKLATDALEKGRRGAWYTWHDLRALRAARAYEEEGVLEFEHGEYRLTHKTCRRVVKTAEGAS